MSLRNSMRDMLDGTPSIYIKLLKARHYDKPFSNRIVSEDSDIVIEGFPRSGNSFANRAFAHCNPSARIATHVHASAHIVYAAKLDIPTLVTIRNPAECIPSLYALRCGLKKPQPKKNHEQSNLNSDLKRYITFHKRIVLVKDKILVAPFESISSDYGAVIQGVNDKFSVNFVPFYHTKENQQEIFDMSDAHLSPKIERERDKQLGVEMYKESSEVLLAAAEKVYSDTLRLSHPSLI